MNPRRFLIVLLCLFAGDGLVHAETAAGRCRTDACWKRVHHARAARWCHRHASCVWRHRWRALPAWERAWARCVASLETRGVPWALKAAVDTGNGYYGATQWLAATWHAAGGSGLPTQHTLSEQLVRTVWWARRESPRQWSTSARCGR